MKQENVYESNCFEHIFCLVCLEKNRWIHLNWDIVLVWFYLRVHIHLMKQISKPWQNDDHGFKELVLPAVDFAVLTTFPFNNTVSIFIAVARVYPKLAEYIKVRFIGGYYFNKT